jgi:uncharacterized damage-inducible protein DinB
MTDQVLDIIKSEFKRRVLEESLVRIESCTAQLTEEEFWRKPNKNSNSIGHLVLHLKGNVTQYILSGIGGMKDERNRDLEFTSTALVDKNDLVKTLGLVLLSANGVVSNLKYRVLSESRKVQGFDENVLSIIIHVIEHLSYHVGQITYYTKYIKDIDTGYYKDKDLSVTS